MKGRNPTTRAATDKRTAPRDSPRDRQHPQQEYQPRTTLATLCPRLKLFERAFLPAQDVSSPPRGQQGIGLQHHGTKRLATNTIGDNSHTTFHLDATDRSNRTRCRAKSKMKGKKQSGVPPAPPGRQQQNPVTRAVNAWL